MKKKLSIIKVYFAIFSLASFVGLLVAYWIAIQSLIYWKLISNEEYIQWSYNNYELKSCEDPTIPSSVTTAKTGKKTQKDIDLCQEKAKKSIITMRNYNEKTNIIWWLLWGTLSLIVFIVHILLFTKKEKQED
jgi:disulfide bond formation protein DsbB